MTAVKIVYDCSLGDEEPILRVRSPIYAYYNQ
jgi:hypothetical protein